jgi:uncharacterized membrane protein
MTAFTFLALDFVYYIVAWAEENYDQKSFVPIMFWTGERLIYLLILITNFYALWFFQDFLKNKIMKNKDHLKEYDLKQMKQNIRKIQCFLISLNVAILCKELP